LAAQKAASEKAALELAAQKAASAAAAAIDAANKATEAANAAAEAADARAAAEAADKAALKLLAKKFVGNDQALSNFLVFGKMHNFLSNDRTGQF
jgi:hypothetical protein